MKLRIGIDVDGCVYPWTKAVNDALEQKYGIEGLVEHTSWDYLQETITKQQWEWAWSSDAAEVIFGRLDLIYPGAQEAVNLLCQEHEVHFVTHRHPRRVAGITGRWLNYHFRNYTGVHVIHNRCAKYTLGNWDIFVDDKPKTVLEFLMDTGTTMLMPDRPWNHEASETWRKEGVRSFRPFKHWGEVPDLVETVLA